MNNNYDVGQSDDQLLRISDIAELTTLSKSCINLWAAQGKFPKPITLSRTVKVWRFKEIRVWAEEQLAKSEEQQNNDDDIAVDLQRKLLLKSTALNPCREHPDQ